MDKFIYAVALKEIELCKGVGTLESLIRRYVASTKHAANELYRTPTLQQIEIVILNYKLLCFSLNLFSKRSNRTLPEFIYDTRTNTQERILSEILKFPLETHNKVTCFTKLTTYEEFIDYFEFDNKLNLPTFAGFVEILNTIIGDKPIHFDIVFNPTLSQFDFHSTNLSRKFQTLIYAIRYKQVNFPTQPQTVWDLFISKFVAATKHAYTDNSDVSSEILKLEQQITALQTLRSYYDK